MRNIITALVGCAFAFGAIACDGEVVDPFPTNDTVVNNDTAVGDTVVTPDTPTTTQYFAAYVRDLPTYDCSNNSGNHGADIDAFELLDTNLGTSDGYATSANGLFGDGTENCTGDVNTDNQVFTDVTGAPDGALAGGFVALAGGYVTAEFGSAEIVDAHTIQVFEVGVDECGGSGCKDDTFEVGIATGLECDVTTNACSVLLSSTAAGDAAVPVGI